jgi:ornithine cyclodeaminase/alanine dehydrogenase-like protein (mu-crystallin family)
MNELLASVLRVTPEPYLHLDDMQIHHRLTRNPQQYMNYIRIQLDDIASGRAALELPHKQVFSDPEGAGDFRVMPCVVRNGVEARKIVKLVGTNVAQSLIPDQITVGKAFALHPEEDFITHIFDACLLSSARTGVCAALALVWLAESRARIAIVGAGRVGYYAAFYAAAIGGVDEIVLSDRDVAKANRAAALLGKQFPAMQFRAQGCGEVSDCDALIIATTSTEPLCTPDDCKAPVIISLGADSESQHELDPSWAGAADIYVDTLDSAHFGDLLAWHQAGLIALENVTDMFGILRNGVSQHGGKTRIFISTGSALFDNLTIGYLLDGADA